MEGAVRTVIASKLNIVQYINEWYLFVVITAVALIVFAVCILVELFAGTQSDIWKV